jgi:hypothetical protein
LYVGVRQYTCTKRRQSMSNWVIAVDANCLENLSSGSSVEGRRTPFPVHQGLQVALREVLRDVHCATRAGFSQERPHTRYSPTHSIAALEAVVFAAWPDGTTTTSGRKDSPPTMYALPLEQLTELANNQRVNWAASTGTSSFCASSSWSFRLRALALAAIQRPQRLVSEHGCKTLVPVRGI